MLHTGTKYVSDGPHGVDFLYLFITSPWKQMTPRAWLRTSGAWTAGFVKGTTNKQCYILNNILCQLWASCFYRKHFS